MSTRPLADDLLLLAAGVAFVVADTTGSWCALVVALLLVCAEPARVRREAREGN